MRRISLPRVIFALVGFAGAVAQSGPAQAQNYDANLQVRFGSFFQGAGVTGDAARSPGDGSGAFSYFSKGIGFVSGIEIVNKQGWNYGVEIDAAFMDGSTDSFGVKFGIDYIVTARGRLGRHLRPDLLWYASTGPALRGSDLTTFEKLNRTRWGWSFGSGLEWDYGGGILFGEYTYAGFGAVNLASGGTSYSYDADAHMFRLGLKFKVGHDHYYHDDVAERIGRRQERLK